MFLDALRQLFPDRPEPDGVLLGTLRRPSSSEFVHARVWRGSSPHDRGAHGTFLRRRSNVEDYLGHFTYLFFYLTVGLAAAATHILLNQGSRLPSVGASGAIAGVMGAYFILYPRARVLIWFPPIFLFHVPAWLMLGYWFVVNFLSGTTTAIAETHQTLGGIAFWAHVGGFVAGLVFINIFAERPQRYRYWTW